MDTTALYNDEVIADSEDEGDTLRLQINFDVSSVQTTFPDITNNIGPSGISQISSFTNKAPASLTSIIPASSTSPRRPAVSSPVTIPKDTISSSSTPSLLPRPKPRPAYKKKDNAETIDSSSNNLPSIMHTHDISSLSQSHMNMPSSIADRAKMRSRKTKSNTADPVFLGDRNSNLSVRSEDVIELSTDEDVIELSTDEDELALLPPPKAKGKRKANMKSKSKGSSDSPLSSAPESDPMPRPKPKPKVKKRSKASHPLSPHAQPTSQGTTMSSGDPMVPIPFHLLSSQLPPSDPPMSTATTCDLPPIETLPNLDTDPLSSPSSLFNAPMSVRKKRKRVTPGVDELDSDDRQIPGIEMDTDRRMMPPPSVTQPLFAQPPPASVDASPRAVPNHFAGSVDLSTIPATSDIGINSVVHVKKSTINKTRKKKGDDDITENRLNKPKPKGKGKEKKGKKVEVVIPIPKGKGKGKEKEVFKSREFIDDDDEDENLKVGAPRKKITTSDKPSSVTSLSPAPDSDKEDLVGPSKKRKSSSEAYAQSAKGKVSTDDEDEPAPKRATRKAKRLPEVVSEDEEDDPVRLSPLPKAPPLDTPSNTNGTNRRKNSKPKKTIPEAQYESDNLMKDIDVDPVQPQTVKENVKVASTSEASTGTTKPSESLFPSLSSRYTIAPKTKPTPMSDLIRRVNSLPGSPFPTPQPRVSRLSTAGTAYSPYLKSSRTMLSRIAPLHPNRRTPPPPLPPPPPPKKTKKEKEREEQWEEELIESVGGITEWACMTDTERKDMRKLKREREMAGWEE